jgi:hypothetical protein
LDASFLALDGMRVPEAAGHDYRTSHWEVKWANDLFLMNFWLWMSCKKSKDFGSD